MTTTLLIAAGFAAVVIGGNVWYDHKNSNPINWKRTLISASIAFCLTVLIGVITE